MNTKKAVDEQLVNKLFEHLIKIISETNAINITHTLELLSNYLHLTDREHLRETTDDFRLLLSKFQQNLTPMNELLNHPMAHALFKFFQNFPLTYREEHIHLTGSLTAEFIYPHLKKLLNGPNKKIYEEKICRLDWRNETKY